MKKYHKILLLTVALAVTACEDSIDVKIPSGMYDAEKVFENEQTAESAVRGMYQSMITYGFGAKTNPLVAVLGGFGGMAADELIRQSYSAEQQLFLDNNLNEEVTINSGIWASFYKYVYQSNRIYEGVENSTTIKEPLRSQFMGEARFVRALTFFYLTNLYKNIPVPLVSDYKQNAQILQTPQEAVYLQVIADLEQALSLFDSNIPAAGNRYRAGYWPAKALLARVHLYRGQWALAEGHANDIIANSAFALEPIPSVFTANSKEAIWQLANPGSNIFSPEAAYMSSAYNIFTNANFRMSPFLIQQFASTDQRLLEWTKAGTAAAAGTRAPRKLKVTTSLQTNAITEASTPLRLAEIYLIRAEARAQLDNLDGAIADVDAIRKRAGAVDDPTALFQTLAVLNPTIQKEAIIEFIYDERLRELFAENGHRWFDAKRSGKKLADFFGERKADIEETDAYFPIPKNERLYNTKLEQNDGY